MPALRLYTTAHSSVSGGVQPGLGRPGGLSTGSAGAAPMRASPPPPSPSPSPSPSSRAALRAGAARAVAGPCAGAGACAGAEAAEPRAG
eukprot:scaffold4675_cov378-Prasinococcus_capsulatus_cf.AAC.1